MYKIILLDVVNDTLGMDRRFLIFTVLAVLSLAALVGIFIYRRRRDNKS